jgi:hypothetical protein
MQVLCLASSLIQKTIKSLKEGKQCCLTDIKMLYAYIFWWKISFITDSEHGQSFQEYE